MSHFALRFKKSGELARFNLSSNEGADFCADISVCLSDSKYDSIWITRERYEAAAAIVATDDWWNEVCNQFGSDALEVVEVEVVIK